MDTELFNNLFLTQKMVDDLVENSLDKYDKAIWIKNREGRYIAVNRAVCNLLGESEETILNSTHNEFFEEELFKPIEKSNIEVINKKQKSIVNEYLYIKGREIVMHIHKIPIIQSDDSCNSFLGYGNIIKGHADLYDNIIVDDNDNLTYDLIIDNKDKREKNLYIEIFEYIKDIYDMLKIKGISVWNYNNKHNVLRKKMSLGVAKGILDDYDVPISHIEEEWFICRSKIPNPPTLVNIHEEIYKKSKFLNEYEKQLRDKFIISSPIVDGDKMLGIVNLYFDMPLFTDETDSYIKKICSRIALTMKNIELFNEVMVHIKDKIKLENLLSRYLNLTVDICLVTDHKGKVKKMSSSIVRLLGFSSHELVNIPIEQILYLDNNNSIELQELYKVYNKKTYGSIARIRCKNGEFKYIEWYYYNDKENKEIFIVGQDVTYMQDLKKKTILLEEKIQQEKFKNQFLSNISHEFKTPLNILLSAIQLQLSQYNHMSNSEKENNNNYKQLHVMRQNSYRLLRLVNNLIDITKIDSHYIKLKKQNLNLVYFVEDIVDSSYEHITEMNRSITFDTSDEEIVLGFDPNAMERIILNLISNSVKFTECGGKILVKVSSNYEEKKAYISVKDDGIGISEEAADIVFDRFSQVDDLLTRRSEGSGIGLAIVKSFTELHGGEVFLNKDLDKGTEITIGLPIKKVDSSEEQSFQDKVLDSRDKRFEIEFSDIYMDCS